MGSGKSRVGKEVSSLLGCPYVDLDAYIEDSWDETIPEIFARGGEELFRKIESSALREVIPYPDSNPVCGPPTVLSLGGGTLVKEENAALVKSSTFCIYLRAGVDTLVTNLEKDSEGRPMLKGEDLRERITTLMKERESTYSGCASKIIDIDGRDFDGIAREIAAFISKNYPSSTE